LYYSDRKGAKAMGLIPKTICPKCGTEYSALKADCPNCGARKQTPGTRATSSSDAVRKGTAANMRAEIDSRWQLVLGLCLVAAVIIGVIVLIMTTIKGDYDVTAAETPSVIVSETPSPSTTPSPTPTPTPAVTSLTITFLGKELANQEFTEKVGDMVQLNVTINPLQIEGPVTWTSSDETIVSVDAKGLVTGVGKGWASVQVQCYGATAKCKVYVK
jgi:hypothetical protein